MSHHSKKLSSILMAVGLFSPVLLGGCAARASYRIYDPAYADYHVWDNNEGVYYQRWETQTHREHRDFRKRDSGEQQEYWKWRHAHPEDKH